MLVPPSPSMSRMRTVRKSKNQLMEFKRTPEKCLTRDSPLPPPLSKHQPKTNRTAVILASVRFRLHSIVPPASCVPPKHNLPQQPLSPRLNTSMISFSSARRSDCSIGTNSDIRRRSTIPGSCGISSLSTMSLQPSTDLLLRLRWVPHGNVR